MYRDQAKIGIMKDYQQKKIFENSSQNRNKNKNIALITQNSADIIQTNMSSRAMINPHSNTFRISIYG